jgi:hypothetical protein
MKQLLMWIFFAIVIPLGFVALLFVFFLLHEAWEFMTLPTSASIERRIMAEIPKGADKGTVQNFLKNHELGDGELRKVTAIEKQSLTNYQEEHIKSQIDLIEYEVGGGGWVASWGPLSSYFTVSFYFNKDEKLIDYTFRKFYEAP